MSRSWCRASAFWYGELPPVCVKSGAPADGTVRTTFERIPPWTFLLLFAGIFPFFIAAMVVTEVRRAGLWITGVPVTGTPFVEIRRVHPDFAAAVAEQHATH